jgi:hypothetical protein
MSDATLPVAGDRASDVSSRRGLKRLLFVVAAFAFMAILAVVYDLWSRVATLEAEAEANSMCQVVINEGLSPDDAVVLIGREFNVRINSDPLRSEFDVEIVLSRELPRGVRIWPQVMTASISFRDNRPVSYVVSVLR